jgi:UDP-N-acetyl-2-amino-2-deoxyglucuronate dehydrogenase
MTDSKGQDPLGVGIVGAGHILGHHAQAFARWPRRARLVAVADLDVDRAEKARRAHGFEAAVGDHRQLLDRKDVDVVCVCTRPDTHAAIVSEALDAGKHVLCEKPMALTLEHADVIAAAAERHPELKLSFVFQWRTDAAFRRLQALAGAGRMGRLLMADVDVRTRPGRRYYEGGARRESWALDGGGRLMTVGIHQLDLLLACLGDAVEASARMDTFMMPSEAEDSIAGWIRFANGAIATLKVTACAKESFFRIEVLGERALVRLDGGIRGRPPAPHRCSFTLRANQGRARLAFDALRAVPPVASPPGWVAHAQRLGLRLLGRPWRPPASWFHGPLVDAFLRAIERDEPVPVSAAEARRSLELTLALYQSALSGETVRLPLGPESPVYQGVDPDRIPSARGVSA